MCCSDIRRRETPQRNPFRGCTGLDVQGTARILQRHHETWHGATPQLARRRTQRTLPILLILPLSRAWGRHVARIGIFCVGTGAQSHSLDYESCASASKLLLCGLSRVRVEPVRPTNITCNRAEHPNPVTVTLVRTDVSLTVHSHPRNPAHILFFYFT